MSSSSANRSSFTVQSETFSNEAQSHSEHVQKVGQVAIDNQLGENHQQSVHYKRALKTIEH